MAGSVCLHSCWRFVQYVLQGLFSQTTTGCASIDTTGHGPAHRGGHKPEYMCKMPTLWRCATHYCAEHAVAVAGVTEVRKVRCISAAAAAICRSTAASRRPQLLVSSSCTSKCVVSAGLLRSLHTARQVTTTSSQARQGLGISKRCYGLPRSRSVVFDRRLVGESAEDKENTAARPGTPNQAPPLTNATSHCACSRAACALTS